MFLNKNISECNDGISTESKDHKPNIRISWMYRYRFYDLKMHFELYGFGDIYHLSAYFRQEFLNKTTWNILGYYARQKPLFKVFYVILLRKVENLHNLIAQQDECAKIIFSTESLLKTKFQHFT